MRINKYIYIPLIIIAAFILIIGGLTYEFQVHNVVVYLFFIPSIALLARLKVYLPHGESIAPATTLSSAALLLFPFPASIYLSVVGILLSGVFGRRKSPSGGALIVVAARSVVAGTIAITAYLLLGGSAFGEGYSSEVLLRNWLPTLGLFVVYHMADFSMEEFGLSVYRRDARLSIGQILEMFRLLGPAYLSLASIGILTAVLLGHLGSWVLVLVVAMLLLFRHALNLYLSVAQAYDDTILALARAVDVHEDVDGPSSVAVEKVARCIGRELRLTRLELDLLSKAALLINLGRIGMDDPEVNKEEDHHASRAAKILSKADGLRLIGVLVEHQDIHLSNLKLPPREILLTQCLLIAKLSCEAYVSGRSVGEVRNHLKRESGKAYHPRVVTAFQRAVAQGNMFQRDDLDLPKASSERSPVPDSPYR